MGSKLEKEKREQQRKKQFDLHLALTLTDWSRGPTHGSFSDPILTCYDFEWDLGRIIHSYLSSRSAEKCSERGGQTVHLQLQNVQITQRFSMLSANMPPAPSERNEFFFFLQQLSCYRRVKRPKLAENSDLIILLSFSEFSGPFTIIRPIFSGVHQQPYCQCQEVGVAYSAFAKTKEGPVAIFVEQKHSYCLSTDIDLRSLPLSTLGKQHLHLSGPIHFFVYR